MPKILVSACLLGEKVRWNSAAKPIDDPRLAAMIAAGDVVPFCPECAAGLAVPRPAAEIEPGGDADRVLAGSARVIDRDGADFSEAFRVGATAAVARARAEGVRFALLAEGSPSCGTGFVADGHFAGRRIPGAGVTARALAEAGVVSFASVEALVAALAEDADRARADAECPHLSAGES